MNTSITYIRIAADDTKVKYHAKTLAGNFSSEFCGCGRTSFVRPKSCGLRKLSACFEPTATTATTAATTTSKITSDVSYKALLWLSYTMPKVVGLPSEFPPLDRRDQGHSSLHAYFCQHQLQIEIGLLLQRPSDLIVFLQKSKSKVCVHARAWAFVCACVRVCVCVCV